MVEDGAALDGLSHRLSAENRTTLSPIGDRILSGQHRTALRSLGHHCVSSLQGTTGHSRQMTIGRGWLLGQNGDILIRYSVLETGSGHHVGQDGLVSCARASGEWLDGGGVILHGLWQRGADIRSDVATQHAARGGVRGCRCLVCAFGGLGVKDRVDSSLGQRIQPNPAVSQCAFTERRQNKRMIMKDKLIWTALCLTL